MVMLVIYSLRETKLPNTVDELPGNDCVVPFESVSVIVPEEATTPASLARKMLAPSEVTPGLNEIVSASLWTLVRMVLFPPAI